MGEVSPHSSHAASFKLPDLAEIHLDGRPALLSGPCLPREQAHPALPVIDPSPHPNPPALEMLGPGPNAPGETLPPQPDRPSINRSRHDPPEIVSDGFRIKPGARTATLQSRLEFLPEPPRDLDV